MSKKRVLEEISNSIGEESEKNVKKVKNIEQEFPNLTEFSTFSNSEVIEMLSKTGLTQEQLNSIKNPLINGSFLSIAIETLSNSFKFEHVLNLIKYILNGIIPCDNEKDRDEIFETLISIYVPRNILWIQGELKVDCSKENWVEQMYEDALTYELNRNEEKLISIEDLEIEIQKTFKGRLERFCYHALPLTSHESFVQKLPIRNGGFAKHYLPFMPSLHIETKNDKLLESMEEGTVKIISASGDGKTSLMIRQLCKFPGILITGTTFSEGDSGQTTDESVRYIAGWLAKPRLVTFSVVRQSVQILLISKLLFILHLIELTEKDSNILDGFEGSLLSFLAFNQFNGANLTICSIFANLFSNCKHIHCNELRNYTISLIDKVKRKTNSSRFLICVDEANVIEEHICSPFFYSVNGNERGPLTVFVSEILRVNRNGLNFYAGTSHSIDICDEVVQFMTGNSPISVFEFEYLDYQSFCEYVGKHLRISDKMEEIGNFPIRIRQAALCVEYFINHVLNGKKETLENCFRKSSEAFKKYPQTKNLIKDESV